MNKSLHPAFRAGKKDRYAGKIPAYRTAGAEMTAYSQFMLRRSQESSS